MIDFFIFAEMKKVVREQYGLINFGEFRRKIGFLSEKNAVKLNELIYNGNTQVRVKGKTIRIKTPVCRALRKINQLQGIKNNSVSVQTHLFFLSSSISNFLQKLRRM